MRVNHIPPPQHRIIHPRAEIIHPPVQSFLELLPIETVALVEAFLLVGAKRYVKQPERVVVVLLQQETGVVFDEQVIETHVGRTL